MRSITILTPLLVLLALTTTANAAFSTVVENGEEECFTIRAPANVQSTINGNFDVLDDELSPDPIGVVLYDPSEKPVWRSVPKSSEGTFSVPRASGKYELCIQNGKAGSDDYVANKDGSDREVGFAVRVIPPQRGVEGEAGPDDRLTSNLIDMSDRLMEGLRTMSDHQEYMRERENKHMVLADLTFNRIVQWTVLEAVVLILISFGQVLYLKKFFEQRRYL
mmetsp:Transcript_2395/g.5185  ORF Transcript_2395/g.5185 Transcript_2395/m.5185 type:complete len:221 (-) Transcript_2395:145-807(-)|eukprot:CAMPEP_0171332342 /NCGR_PEP_ID=MMETSP0878-20121228/3287_1 /TAXON_ID=67004 /ORGANISM="Thalassiosira weissflogii, Strain CCMP1336" /LENGTH=220 /DNA_ID=CAMNT_0011833049 /DNA_START=210 /DNA_END=872 /DNA_ORIENTATION=-